MKKGLKITFINPNTEEQIVQAMAGVLAYNLAENDNKIIFDYNSNAYQNSHSMEDEELEQWYDVTYNNILSVFIIKDYLENKLSIDEIKKIVN